jgi:hypothetical protein
VTNVLAEPATKADVTAAKVELTAAIAAAIAAAIETMATKEDLKQYATKADLEIWGGALRAEMKDLGADLRAELRAELRADLRADLRAESAELCAEMRHLFQVQLEQLYSIIKMHVEGTDTSIGKLELKLTADVADVRSELDTHRADTQVHRTARRRPARRRPAGARRPPRTRR